jgi:hypothetical protein
MFLSITLILVLSNTANSLELQQQSIGCMNIFEPKLSRSEMLTDLFFRKALLDRNKNLCDAYLEQYSKDYSNNQIGIVSSHLLVGALSTCHCVKENKFKWNQCENCLLNDMSIYCNTFYPTTPNILLLQDKSTCVEKINSICAFDGFSTSNTTLISCIKLHYKEFENSCFEVIDKTTEVVKACPFDFVRYCKKLIKTPKPDAIESIECLLENYSKLGKSCKSHVDDLVDGVFPCSSDVLTYCSSFLNSEVLKDEESIAKVMDCVQTIPQEKLKQKCVDSLSSFENCVATIENGNFNSSLKQKAIADCFTNEILMFDSVSSDPTFSPTSISIATSTATTEKNQSKNVRAYFMICKYSTYYFFFSSFYYKKYALLSIIFTIMCYICLYFLFFFLFFHYFFLFYF